MIFMYMVTLCMRTSMLMKQRLRAPRMYSFQLDNLQSMILLNLVGWIAAKDDGKLSAKWAQFLIATLNNRLLSKLEMFPHADIFDAHSVCQRSNFPMSAKDSHLQIALLVQWSRNLLLSWLYRTLLRWIISEVDVLNIVPSCEAMEFFSISYSLNLVWARCQK